MTKARFKRLGFSRRWDDRGVASTVGTIMAIMVILALLSLITNHYVPVWMKDNESSHMELALTQLGSLKASVDNQMLSAEVLYYTGNEFASMSVYTAIKLGSEGIPVFASPTPGELAIKQDQGLVSVETIGNNSGTNFNVTETTKGNIGLSVPNRYFVPQTLVYENGAIIRYQNDGEMVVAEPTFLVTNNTVAGNYSYKVAMTIMWLFGVGGTSGSGMDGINSKLIGLDIRTYDNPNSTVYINHTTSYGDAWYKYYNSTLTQAYEPDPSGVVYSKTSTTTTAETSFYKITLTKLGFQNYKLSVELKNTGNCLKRLKLNIAYVNIAIGSKRGETEF